MIQSSVTLRQLAYFVAVADAGTISSAARSLHVSQPGLSQALTELERALQTQLLVRRKAHGITLTASGQQVAGFARDLLRRVEDLAGIASGGDLDSLTGTLALGCYSTLGPTVLPPLLEDFHFVQPGVVIDFEENTQDVLQRRLLQGNLDLAILYDMEIDPDLTYAVIDAVRPHILLPADHRLADSTSVSLADVVDEPQILLDAPPSSHNTLAIFQRFGLTPRIRFRPQTYELARALVGRGLGYALLVQRPSNDRTYDGSRVVTKEIAEPVSDAQVVLAWPRAVHLNRRAAGLVDFCVARKEAARR